MTIMIPHNSNSGQMLVVCLYSVYNTSLKVTAMPILDEHMLDFVSHSPAQTHRLGARMGLLLRPGDVICLEGELGTGKTHLVQGIGHGMGVLGPITSPTFTLIAEYEPPRPAPTLYHIDMYRLAEAEEEALALGLDDYLGSDGVCVIEWADRIVRILPQERLWIHLSHLDTSKRSIIMRASGGRYDDLLRQFKRTAFGI
jgi:tRNA threonylcarbamoyladenosine biosynthesis protein TsaE